MADSREDIKSILKRAKKPTSNKKGVKRTDKKSDVADSGKLWWKSGDKQAKA